MVRTEDSGRISKRSDRMQHPPVAQCQHEWCGSKYLNRIPQSAQHLCLFCGIYPTRLWRGSPRNLYSRLTSLGRLVRQQNWPGSRRAVGWLKQTVGIYYRYIPRR